MARNRLFNAQDEQKLIALFRSGLSTKAIAEKLGFCVDTINSRIRDLGLRKQENYVATHAKQSEIDDCLRCTKPASFCDRSCSGRRRRV